MAADEDSWKLRTAGLADRDIVLSILRDADLPLDGVEDRFPAGYVVAVTGNGVIAVGGLEPYGSFGLLRSLAVSTAWRGRGLGRAITDRLLAYAGAMGMEAVFLLTTTAQEYFAGAGFRTVDRKDVPEGIRESVEFAKACPESAVCMSLKMKP